MDKYIDEEFLKELGLENLPPEEKQQLILQFMDVFTKRLILRLLKNLDSQKIDEFENFLEKDPDPIAIFEFLANNIEDFDLIVKDEVQAFRQEALDYIKFGSK